MRWSCQRLGRQQSARFGPRAVREPLRFTLTSEEERSGWLFQTADAGILEEMCEEGYFSDGRPEDEVAFLLDDWDFQRLTEEQHRLNDERL